MSGLIKRLIITTIIFFLTVSLGLVFVYLKQQEGMSALRKIVTEVAAAQAYSISRQLDRSLSATYALASLIQKYGKIDNFDTLAADMIDRYGGISSLQLAPDAVVRQIFPVAGNEAAIGHDLLNDSNRRIEALATIKSKTLTLAGPLNLIQGGVAVIGRYPVFYSDENSGKETFWGFTIALIRLPGLLHASNISQLTADGYNYELSRINPDGNERFVFAQSNQGQLQDPVSMHVEVPNGRWTLFIAPKNGWLSPRHISLEVAIIILVATIVALLMNQQLRNTAELSTKNELLRREIIERKRLEAELKDLSLTDELTGVYNRRGFFTIAEHKLKDANREKRRLLLLFADIDNLKEVNDAFGHREGDAVLVDTAKILQSTFRDCDIIARIGGDEFVVLNMGSSDNTEDAMNARLQESVDTYNTNSDRNYRISISAGMVEYNVESPHSLNDLLSRADKFMYEQKKHKRKISLQN